MTELKPCPFCGWLDITILCYGMSKYKVICTKCHIQTQIDTMDKVVETWNRRVKE